MAAMTPMKHFKTGRLAFALRTLYGWHWLYFPDVDRTEWRRASAFIIIPDEELKVIQYPAGYITLRARQLLHQPSDS